MKYARMWATDGSFYTEDLEIIKKAIVYIDGKQDYTIIDGNGNIIALAQVNY